VFSLYALIVAVVELAWLAVIAYVVFRLLRAFVPALNY
jgi:hypothetical protein